MEGFSGTQSLGSIWEKPKKKDYNSGRHGLMPLPLMVQCQRTAWTNGYASEETKFLYQRILTPRTTPKNRVEERMAGGARQTIKIELLVQGIQQNAVLENQGRVTKIQDLVHTLKTQYRTESVIADLSKTGVFNTFSEEPKKTFQKLGKIELFELGDVFTKIQCPACAMYWPGGLLYGTCGICFRPSKEQKRKIKDHLEILSIRHCVVKRTSSRGAKHGRSQ